MSSTTSTAAQNKEKNKKRSREERNEEDGRELGRSYTEDTASTLSIGELNMDGVGEWCIICYVLIHSIDSLNPLQSCCIMEF